MAGFTDSRVRYVFQMNRSLSAARSSGVRAARGEQLAFLDADDEWEPGLFQRCVAILTSENRLAGVFVCTRLVDEKGRVLPREDEAQYAKSHSGYAGP